MQIMDKGFQQIQETNNEPTFAERAAQSLTRMGFSVIKPLGSGTFGDVLMVEDGKGGSFAAKIVKPPDTTYGELFLWKDLQHPNVLPLTSAIDLVDVPAFCFQMPVQASSYEDLIENPHFYNSSDSMPLTINIIKDVLSGLKYLHDNGYAHMDLKTNNILVSSSKRAFLCDFTFLTKPNKDVKSYGTPLHLRPPEACVSKGPRVPVDGRAFDCWTLGLLFLDGLTRHITWRLPNMPNNWMQLTYPALRQFLKEDSFAGLMRAAHPGQELSDAEVSRARNFVLMFLRLRPEDRPTMDQAVAHAFLGSGDYWAPEDDLWKEPDYSLSSLIAFNKHNPFIEAAIADLVSKEKNDEVHKFCNKNPFIDDCTYVLSQDHVTQSVADEPRPLIQNHSQTKAVSNDYKAPININVQRSNKTEANKNQTEKKEPYNLAETFSPCCVIADKELLLPKEKSKKGFRGALRWIQKKFRNLKKCL